MLKWFQRNFAAIWTKIEPSPIITVIRGHKKVEAVLNKNWSDSSVYDFGYFDAEGECGPAHDWATDKEGAANEKTFAGSPDLQQAVHDLSRKYDALLEEYSGASLREKE